MFAILASNAGAGYCLRMAKTIILDTSALRNATVNSAGIQNLFALSALGAVRVCIPRIVLDEWRTQFRDALRKGHANLRDEVRGFLSHSFATDPAFADLSKFAEFLNSVEPEQVSIAVSAATAEKHCLSICEISEHHGQAVFEKFFAGTGCFLGNPKNRRDLPDAFIYEAVSDVIGGAGEEEEVVFVVNDGNLRIAVERDLGIRCFTTVKELMNDQLLEVEQSDRAYEIGWQRILDAILAERDRFDELILEHELREFPGRFSQYAIPLPGEFHCIEFRHFIIREWGTTELEHTDNAPGWLIVTLKAEIHGEAEFIVSSADVEKLPETVFVGGLFGTLPDGSYTHFASAPLSVKVEHPFEVELRIKQDFDDVLDLFDGVNTKPTMKIVEVLPI